MGSRQHPLMRQAEDRQEEEKRQREREYDERQLDEAYAAVAETAHGAIVLRDLVATYGTRHMPFTGNSRDAYNMGMAHACDKLVSRLKRCLSRRDFIDLMYPEEEKKKK